jgi:type IV pilus assembly protein PilA
MSKRIWNTAICLALLLVVSACKGSPESELVGNWYEIGGEEHIQFFQDGTIVISGEGNYSGDYSILDEKTMRIDLGGLGALTGPLIAEYEIAGEILSLRSSGGDTDRYTKNEKSARTGKGLILDDSDPEVAAAMRDAEIRSQVTEGLNLAGGPKVAVTEFYQDNGRFPSGNREAGLSDATEIQGMYVSAVAVQDGIITASFAKGADDAIRDKSLILTPKAGDGYVSWECSSRQIKNKYLPAACR